MFIDYSSTFNGHSENSSDKKSILSGSLFSTNTPYQHIRCKRIVQKYTLWLTKSEGIASCLITAKLISYKIKGRSLLKIEN